MNVILEHRSDRPLKIQFSLAMCNPMCGDMLAIFEAGGNLTNPRAVVMVDAEPGRPEIMSVTFHRKS